MAGVSWPGASATRLVMPVPEDVAACAAHMDHVARQLAAVARYARHEVLGDAGFDGAFRVLVPVLDRVGDAVAAGLGAVHASYRDLAVDLEVSARTMASLDQSLADAMRPILTAAAGVHP